MSERRETFRVWALHCPFRRDGTPVLGTFGATTCPVVVMTTETWTRLCQKIPALATEAFEVGTYHDDD